jgi:hypothetical protein
VHYCPSFNSDVHYLAISFNAFCQIDGLMQVTWFNVTVLYDAASFTSDTAYGQTAFIIGLQITTTTGYTCMIGSNNTQSVAWRKSTDFTSDYESKAWLTPVNTTITFNTTQNEYVTDFHVYLARDISKEPWIDATLSPDDYDCKFIIASGMQQPRNHHYYRLYS